MSSNLSPLVQSFVLHFGEMGSRWGINRTVGQVYALLYISPQPLCADDIVEALGISRSNVSMSLKELQAWNLAILKHFPGDRRDFFTTPEDVWHILRTLAEERKKREIDPTLSVLREILMETPENEDERHAQRRIDEMKTLIEQLTGWYDDVKRLETERLASLLALGSKVTKLLEAKDKIVSLVGPASRKRTAKAIMTMSAQTPPLADSRDDGCSAPVALSLGTRRRVFSIPGGKPRADKAPTPQKMHAPGAARSASLLHVLVSLFWLPQAGLLAFSVGKIADGAPMMALMPPAAAIFLLGILKALLEKTAARMSFRMARAALSQRRLEALHALARVSPLDLSRTASGEVAAVVAETSEALVPYLSRFQPARMKATIVPVAYALVILPFSWIAALVLLLAMPTIPLFMALIGWQAKAASEKQLVEAGNMNAFLLDRLRGLETIRALEAVDLTATRLSADAQNLKKRTMAVLRIAFLSSAVLELFAALGVAMTAVYIGFHLLGFLDFGAWGQKLTLAEGLFILLLAPAFFEPLRELSAVWHDRAAGEAALGALDNLAKGGSAIAGTGKDAPDVTVATPATVDLHDLTFAYPGASPVLRNFDFNVRAGETVALLGPSGCGKSTVLSLIAGLAKAQGGTIKIGGTVLDDETADILRKSIGWIGQKPFFTAGSLEANIRFGRAGVTRSMVDMALESTGLDQLSSSRGHLPVGDGGHGISGGEAVRLAIARAFADPAARLILADEPTAHLDRETAELVTENLLQLAKGRTLIVATHDPVLAARMDRVVDMAAVRSGDPLMMSRFAILKPVIALFWSARSGMLLAGAVLAATTVLAGIGLLGISGWFITTTAIAGLLPATAYAFDVFAPSAAIRLLALARTAARYGERMTTHEATLSILAALREKLFRGFAAPQAAKNLQARPARLLNRLTADIDALDSLYLRVLLPAAVAVLAAIATGIGLAFIDPLAGLLAALFLVASGLGIAVRAALRAEKFSRRRAVGLEALRARAADLVGGQAELLVAGRLASQVEAVKRADDYLLDCDEALNRIETNAGFSFGVATAVLLSATLLGVAWLAEQEKLGAPAAALGLLVCLAALEPFTALRRGAMELGRTLFSARRIAPRLAPAAALHCPPLPAGGIAAKLQGVRLEREGNVVLTGIELEICAGERLAIVGPSGAGKTSLIQLLAGELQPSAGTVSALPSSPMTQRSQLFRDSIADNLRLANPAATESQLWEVLTAAGLAEHVKAMPGRLEARLGEAGQGLSGGQSRRLALARFLLTDKPLWLLDEVTEGLDGETARDVLARLFASAEGRTVVVITHNRREAEFADRIVVLKEGRQFDECQSGTPEYGVVLNTLRPD